MTSLALAKSSEWVKWQHGWQWRMSESCSLDGNVQLCHICL